jgi:hypothetical protein
MTKINHISHGLGDHVTGHHGTNIAQNGAPKKVTAIEVHSGMRTKSAAGDAYGGQHKSALDALTGATVPAGRVTAPGWGSGTVRSGDPTAHAPASKNVRPVPVHPSQSRGADKDNAMHELGRAILEQAGRAGKR